MKKTAAILILCFIICLALCGCVYGSNFPDTIRPSNTPIVTMEQTNDIPDIADLLEKAEKALSNNEYDNAIKYCNDALEISPKEAKCYIMLYQANIAQDKRYEALLMLSGGLQVLYECGQDTNELMNTWQNEMLLNTNAEAKRLPPNVINSIKELGYIFSRCKPYYSNINLSKEDVYQKLHMYYEMHTNYNLYYYKNILCQPDEIIYNNANSLRYFVLPLNEADNFSNDLLDADFMECLREIAKKTTKIIMCKMISCLSASLVIHIGQHIIYMNQNT